VPRKSHPRKQQGRAWPPLSPARALVVVEHPATADLIRLTLSHGRCAVRVAAGAAAALAALREGPPHLVVADMAAGGAELLAALAPAPASGPAVPFIALTRRGDLAAMLAAFDRGADDVLALPFPPEELLARAIALMRRSYREPVPLQPWIKVGKLEIDILSRTVRAGTSDVQLTRLQQGLLYLLAANRHRVVGREEILDQLWGADYVAESNVVDQHVRTLRARLQDDWRHPRFIETVPGLGYRLIAAIGGEEAGTV
jgi:DNA-binding response OmpR family regulator